MSIDHTVYLGPYLRCKSSQKQEAVVSWGCKTCEIVLYSRVQKFCTDCGSAMGDWEKVESVDLVNADEVSENIDEQLTCVEIEGFFLWKPNLNKPDEKRFFRFDPDHKDDFEYNPEKDSTEIARFLHEYKDAICKVKDAYGENNTEVTWGLVYHVS